MHIPDGFLDLALSATLYAVSIAFWVISFYKSNKTMTPKTVPLMAVLTAGVFAAQMLNFPIIGGTSGHLLGGTLLSVFLGPFSAIVGMTIILVIQGVIFGDGGLTALGANSFNMGIMTVFVGFAVYYFVRKLAKSKLGIMSGVFAGAWISVMIASAICGIELGISSIFPYGVEVTVPAMLFWHILIGFGEGVISVVVVGTMMETQPDLLPEVEHFNIVVKQSSVVEVNSNEVSKQ
ncbi:MAG: energy-coupling factor ABC transporter permease [Promethearchaeota archaeon]